MRGAIALAVVNDVNGSQELYAQPVDSLSGAYAMRASRAVEGYFYRRNGRLEIRATVEDPARTKTVEILEAGGPAAQGVLPLVNAVAKKMSASAHAFQTANEDAFRAYGKALSSADRAEMLKGFEAASQADPRFSQVYLDWAKVLLAGGDPAGAVKVIEQGLRGQPDPISRAQLEYTRASIQGDLRLRMSALESLARLTPADSKVIRELAELQVASRQFREAARSYDAAARLDPEEPQIWNEMGYALAYSQDLSGAKQALERYQELLPKENANALDSLGEVSFYLRDFAGAAKYFEEADQRNRGQFGGAELVKAAQARLLAGDLEGGNALFQKYAGLFQGEQGGRGALQATQWEFLTGRRKQAMQGLEKIIPVLEGEARSQALSQLSVWKLMTGDQKTAVELADQAATGAASARARNLSTLCRMISRPQASRSGSAFVDAYALMFARKYAEATPLLERLYRETAPAGDGQIRTLLAWAYVETNRIQDADRLLGTCPLPLNSGEPLFASLVFPRYLFLRGVVLERQGKRADAKTAYESYLKYAGDVPDIFGDATRARESLTRL